ncbi:RNA-binding S4 domain-containing protein [uncultured Porphyromonas sp.]|jgi:heat shock protein 15|uniref:RNA-binding S4 domain-containing protein n=1 Tax=uncultured Porphyromonas sp. TaxID=159274 RepID=UPI00261A45B4|nr:RNA-binding S4 domain-containing protein [uncultured Porphyromonas sp.]
MEEVRVDKWLWAVRVFKTRSIATEACKKGRVSIGGVTIKPSRTIRVGEVITVRKPPIEYSFRVLQLLASRVGAKRVAEFMENVTPQAQYELLELQRVSGFVDRAKGLGRPTKKDRRDLDQFAEDLPEGMELFDWDEDWD